MFVGCATSDASEDALPPGAEGTLPPEALVDAGQPTDASAPDREAERPLVCGDAGFCETKLPRSNVGEPLSLRSVWAVAESDVWSVSADGLVLHYDGMSWSVVYHGYHPLYAVWATATDAWAAGEHGLLLHSHEGGTWTPIATSHTETYRAIAGTSSEDIWFGHDSGADHFDGTTLTSHPYGVPNFLLTSMAARAGFGAYAVGYVKGAPPSNRAFPVPHVPYIFDLKPEGISNFNPALQNSTSFVPLATVVTDAPEEERRIFLAGYWDGGWHLDYSYATFGNSIPVIQNTMVVVGLEFSGVQDNRYIEDPSRPPPTPPLFPTWGKNWNDIRIALGVGSYVYWDGAAFTLQSLDNMGNSFVPRTLFSVHENATNRWLVGDGFALKGPAL